MSEERPAISTPQLSVSEIARRSFTTVRRGFDPEEVRTYLEMVAEELAAAEQREDELQRELQAAEDQILHPDIDEATLTAALGQRSAAVLRNAHEEAARISQQAETAAAVQLREAHHQATEVQVQAEAAAAERIAEAEISSNSLHQQARQEAAAMLEAARAESEKILERAREEGRMMLDQAQDARRRVLADMGHRRRAMAAQIDQYRAARDEVAAAVVGVRHSVDRIVDDLARADDAARAAAAEVAHRQPIETTAHLLVAEAEMAAAELGARTGSAADLEATAPISIDDIRTVVPSRTDVPVPRQEDARRTDKGGGLAEPPAAGDGGEGAVTGGPANGGTFVVEGDEVPEEAPWEADTHFAEGRVPAIVFDDVGGQPSPPAGLRRPSLSGAPEMRQRIQEVEAPPAGEHADEGSAGGAPGSAGLLSTGSALEGGTFEGEIFEGEIFGDDVFTADTLDDNPVIVGAVIEEAVEAPQDPDEVDATGPGPVADATGEIGAGRQQADEESPGELERRGAADPTGHAGDAAAGDDGVESLFARLRASRETAGHRKERPPTAAEHGRRGTEGGESGSARGRAQGAATASSPEQVGEPGRPDGVPGEGGGMADAAQGAAGGTAATPEAAPTADPDATPEPDGTPAADKARARRAELLDPITTVLARRLKRALQDDQNRLLERLRGGPAEWSEDLLPDEAEQRELYTNAALPHVREAVAAGITFARTTGRRARGKAPVPNDETVAEVVTELSGRVVSQLRRRLSGDETAEPAERVGGAYREWRGERIERLVGDCAVEAFSGGVLSAVPASTGLRWVRNETAHGCADCEDNALGEAVPAGEQFPTGHLHPPAHPGCRCLLLPTPA